MPTNDKVSDDKTLHGTTILITGGSSGIGKKIAQFAALCGAKVIITSSRSDKVLDATEELRKFGHVSGIACDVRDDGEVKRLIAMLIAEESVPHVLINCAAVLGPVGLFHENSFSQWEEAIAIDLVGNMRVVHALLPLMLERKFADASYYPKIINVGGGGAAYSRPYHTAYAAAKTAMVRTTEILAQEYRGKIDVNIIAPGAHKTAIWDTETHDKEPAQWAVDADLFRLVTWLVSEKSNGVTGRFIHIANDYLSLTPEVSDTDRYQLRRTN